MQQKIARPISESKAQGSHTSAPINRAATVAASERLAGNRRLDNNARFGHDLSDIRVYPDTSVLANMRPQNFLRELSKPGDESEQEAERVSDEVMGGKADLPQISARPAGINRMFANSEMLGTEMNFPLPAQNGPQPANGVASAASGATDWLGGKASEAMGGIAGAAQSGLGWLSGKTAEGMGGATGAAQSGLGWLGNTMNDALSGKASLGWLGGKMGEAESGIAGALTGAQGWAAQSGDQAFQAASHAQLQASNWGMNTATSALTGVAGAGVDAARWGTNTANQAAGKATDTAGQAYGGIIDFLQDHPEKVLM